MAVAACLLAGWTPIAFSIATVFLFAGPHNWLEARYFLKRMPGRWGSLAPFFITGIGGVLVLTAGFAALPWLTRFVGDSFAPTTNALWNTALVLWAAGLAEMRRRQNPRRDWPWLWPGAFALVALAWLWPAQWSLALVYLHPLVALVFLDRELGKERPAWRPGYRAALAAVPVLLGVLAIRLWNAPDLPGRDGLTWRITTHAGAGLLSDVSSHFLVAAHTFLEMLHYGVWVAAIPLVSLRDAPWNVQGIPLARRSKPFRLMVVGLLAAGACVMLVLWGGFLADYPMTRDVYFTVAMLHVLAEVPFLLRLV
jgi:hypothetical protein